MVSYDKRQYTIPDLNIKKFWHDIMVNGKNIYVKIYCNERKRQMEEMIHRSLPAI